MHTATRRLATAALGAALTGTLLSGCSLESLGMSSSPTSTIKSHPASTSRTTARTATDVRYVRGDLAAGSLTHTLAVGNRSLVLRYWTTRDVGTWTSSTPATVHVSARLANSGRRTPVLVTGFVVTFATGATSGSVLERDTGRFVITPPYSYDSAVVVPGVARSVRSARMDVQLDLLVATTPTSRQYARQTVIDTVDFDYEEIQP